MVDPSVAISEPQIATLIDPAPSLKARAIVLGMRILGGVPITIRSGFGALVAAIISRLPLRERQIAELQLQNFLPQVSPTKTIPRIYANVCRSALESLNLRPLLQPPFQNISCPAWDRIVSWTKEDRPIIALTAHTGNWDLLGAYTIARGIPLTTIGKEARNPDVQVALRSLREAYGIETIWRSDKGSIKRIVNCFKERRVLAALIDQDTRVDSIPVPFFGTPVKTPSALVDLGKRYNARFISALMVRTTGLNFKIDVRELDSSCDTSEILTLYHQHLEEIIRAYPDQWVWFHKRWRTSPSGDTLGTRDYIEMLRSRIEAKERETSTR